ncbi:unnamed protein product [Schistosoma rodhaini]|uniref:F5/8 type C domain-containing protein n=2 Tax=Schistosoma rodhaini TaxID=6188 RepID=A0AA85F793_9TREM|nr:unnamed protein product [Schistosoma rodhaini]
MWISFKFSYTKQHLTLHISNLCRFLCIVAYFSVVSKAYCSQVPNGVKSVNKDLGPLTLPPSAFSASSVYQNKPEYQPHKANFVVFASKEEISGAWCPAKLIHKELDEWLQIDFGALKLIKVLFSEGGGLNQNAFVPMFIIKYQREDNAKWYEYRMRNGSKLLHANRNSQTIVIQLDPPIIAKRLRILPYTIESNPKLMCLRLAIYGSVFNDGVVEYSIPEGDVYRLDPRGEFVLNDTNYDGVLISPKSSLMNTNTKDNMDKQQQRTSYLTGGLGLLMDKQYFEGNLPEKIDSSSSSPVVVGWFRRKPTTNPYGRITMLFKFDQARNFSQIRIHTLNSLDYIALFRRISVQFSNGGRYFDRIYPPVVVDIHRDIYNSKPRWVPIDLGFRIGRYLRITLWFDYDWIVISEVTFESSYLSDEVVLQTEQSDDPIQKTADFDSSDIDSEAERLSIMSKPSSSDQAQSLTMKNSPSVQKDLDIEKPSSSVLLAQVTLSTAASSTTSSSPLDTPISATFKLRGSNVPYIIAIICCCLGSFAFACFFAFMIFRLKRYRRRRLKKLQKQQKLPHTLDKQSSMHHQHLLLTTARQNQNSLSSTLSTPPSSSCLSSSTSAPTSIPSIIPTSSLHQYNQLKLSNGNHYTTDIHSNNNNGNKMVHPNVVSLLQTPTIMDMHNNYNHLAGALSQGYSEMLTHHQQAGTICAPYSTNGIDQDGLLAFQLLQHGPTVGSNFSALNSLTLARRGLSDNSSNNNNSPGVFAVHPMVTLGTDNKVIGVNLPPTSCNFAPQLKGNLLCSQNSNNNVNNGIMNTTFGAPHSSLLPPPPPDQPLPPLPNLSSDSNNANNRLLINTSLSSVFPYAATAATVSSSFASQAYPTENSFILSIDSPMPEYASASLFSGTGSGTISLGPNDLRNSVISKTTFDSCCDATNKYKQLMETYCVPQHMNSCFWPSNYNNDPNQCQLNFNGIPKLSTPITGTVQMAAATSSDSTHNNTQSSSINNENLSESLDSSGMYYLTHKKHGDDDNNNNDNISPNLIHKNPTVFLPFTAGGGASPATTAATLQTPLGTHLIPIRTIGLRSGNGVASGGIILANRDNSISNIHYQSALTTTTTPASSNHFYHHHGDENMKDLNNFTMQQTTTITPNR